MPIPSPIRRFLLMLKPDTKEIRNIYIFSIFSGIINLSLPLGIQSIVNLIQGGSVNTAWLILLLIVVCGVIATGILQISQLKISENLQKKIFARAAFEFAYRIPKIRLEDLFRRHAPELMNRFFDIISIQKGLSKLLIDFSTAFLQIVFGLLLLSLYHPFFILFSLSLLLTTYVIFRFTAQKGLATSLRESGFKYKVVHWLEEVARTSNSFKLAGSTNLALDKTNQVVEQYLGARENHFKILVNQYILMIGLKALIVLGLLAVGGFLVMEQQMNIGQFVAAEVIIILILSSLEKIVMSLETIYDVITSVEKIGQVTDLKLDRKEGLEIQEGETSMHIELDELSFQYPHSSKMTLQDISLIIKPSQRIVLYGDNGSGKSTLLKLLAGLYQDYKGAIKFNNIDYKRMNTEVLHSQIGDCLSQELLFEGSILENISMGRARATEENIRWAIQHLFLDHYINSLEYGLDTHIEPEGKNLPESIIQKLLLARSIADKPSLLLIEDAFEHIDAKQHDQIIDFLIHPSNPWTLVAVSSDKYLAKKVDNIIFLEYGKIKEISDFSSLSDNSFLR